jgi:hypothetical protein
MQKRGGALNPRGGQFKLSGWKEEFCKISDLMLSSINDVR